MTQFLAPTVSFQLQSSRDQVVSAFFMAQQLAMASDEPVSLVITPPNVIDLQLNGSSTNIGGAKFPMTLADNQTLTAANFNFDRLGKTGSNTLTLSQGSDSVQINVSSTGYVN